MNTRPLLTLIFPAYNERRRILQTLQESVAYFEEKNLTFEIIVSADGTDGTLQAVNELKDPRICAIGGQERRGKGYGVRRAVELAEGKYIGFADADNKTPITEFDLFLPHLQAGIPVVIGSRALKGAQVQTKPVHRRIGSFVFRYCMQVVTGLRGIPDTQCGFKFFQRETAKKLFSMQKTDGYMFDVELLLLARKQQLAIEQIPVRWRDDGDSKLELWRGNFKNLVDLLKLRSAVGRSHDRINARY